MTDSDIHTCHAECFRCAKDRAEAAEARALRAEEQAVKDLQDARAALRHITVCPLGPVPCTHFQAFLASLDRPAPDQEEGT